MSFVDETAGGLCSTAHDLFRDATLGPSLFSLCHITAMHSTAGIVCVEKCHLAQAAKVLLEKEDWQGAATGEKLVQHLSVDLRMLEMK